MYREQHEHTHLAKQERIARDRIIRKAKERSSDYVYVEMVSSSRMLLTRAAYSRALQDYNKRRQIPHTKSPSHLCMALTSLIVYSDTTEEDLGVHFLSDVSQDANAVVTLLYAVLWRIKTSSLHASRTAHTLYVGLDAGSGGSSCGLVLLERWLTTRSCVQSSRTRRRCASLPH